MVNYFVEANPHRESGFFLYDHDRLYEQLIKLLQQEKKVLLIGVSFALLDFVEKYQLPPDNSQLIVMETGGMKGKRRELIRAELHTLLKKGFGVDSIHSEYGMTELLSQAYSKADGLFETPSWMKILCRQQDNPFAYCSPGETGGINVVDLANLYSCPFIQTDDLGKMHSNGKI